ncbi:unnamed protein product [Blepharisma stoltei]|uniref:Sugar transporter SWEET n=1 Tax=Blepharisma stoltei TaxID=1481888 RepID=A0AAU9I8T7_9CILI|nr:unnamed protein product [Blepharisma stoltei]
MEFVPIVLSGLGTLLSIGVNLSPLPSLLKASKSKNLEEISHLYLILSNLIPLIWSLYGLKSKIWLIYIPAQLTFFTSLAWIAWYHIISKNSIIFMFWYLLSIFSSSIIFLNCLTANNLGLAAVIISFGGIFAPLQQVPYALLEMDHKYIDINIMVSCLFCGAVWLLYGYFINNRFIIIPNSVGIIFCLLQIGVYAWARGILPCPCLTRISKFLIAYYSYDKNIMI